MLYWYGKARKILWPYLCWPLIWCQVLGKVRLCPTSNLPSAYTEVRCSYSWCLTMQQRLTAIHPIFLRASCVLTNYILMIIMTKIYKTFTDCLCDRWKCYWSRVLSESIGTFIFRPNLSKRNYIILYLMRNVEYINAWKIPMSCCGKIWKLNVFFKKHFS